MSQAGETEAKGSIDDLIKEAEPRIVRGNGNGSLRSTLSKDHCYNVGIENGSAVQMVVHNGRFPVTVDEQCIIIRPYPGSKCDQ